MFATKQYAPLVRLARHSQRCGLGHSYRKLLALVLTLPLLAVLAACSSSGSDDDEPFVQESQVPFQFKSIEINPPAGTAAIGTRLQFVVMGIKEDSSKENLTTRVRWRSTDSAVADIDAVGVATAIAPGVTIFTAEFTSNGRTLERSAGFTVNSAGLVSISITPANPSIAAGTRLSLTATGSYSDGSTQNISGSVSWQSSNEDIVTTTGANNNAVQANAISAGAARVSATLNGISDTTTVTVTPAILESIAVTPVTATVVAGMRQQFVATGSFSDGSTQNLTTSASWTSSSSATASIGNDTTNAGLATAIATGNTTITATVEGFSDQATLIVTDAELTSIAVTPAAPTIAAGSEQQFTAVGTFSDNSTQNLTTSATWSSSDSAVASIANSNGQEGLATSSEQGTTTIAATLNGISGSTELTVGAQALVAIEVTPTNPSSVAGTTQQFTATGSYSDNSTQNLTASVSWQSSNDAVATIDGGGLASADNAGTSRISATLNGISGATTLTVTVAELNSLEIRPDAPSVTLGDTQQLTATGTFSDGRTEDLTAAVTWGPTNSDIATVSNADDSNGLATARGVGTVTVTAASGEISDDTVLTVVDRVLESLTVTPDGTTQAVGGQQQFTATGGYNVGEPADLTDAVDWTSTNTDVAIIANAEGSKGLADAVGAGTTTIEARLDGQVGSAAFSVTVATLESISVAPAEATVADGDTQQFTATGNFSDGVARDITAEVIWAAANDSVATISNADDSPGLATATAEGETGITATDVDNSDIQGNATLTVGPRRLDGISVTPRNASVVGNNDSNNENNCQQYAATGSYSNGDSENLTQSVSWSSSNEQVAFFPAEDDTGAALFGVACGGSISEDTEVTITAALQQLSDSTTLTVTVPPPVERLLEGIEVLPDDETIGVGDTLQYRAEGTYSNGDVEDIPAIDVNWSVSSDTQSASISNGEDGANGPAGEALGTNAGSATISAEFQGFTDDTSLTVNAPPPPDRTLESVILSPQDETITAGDRLPYSATALYSDDTSEPISASDVTWSVTSEEQAATISNGDDGPAGEALGTNAGTAIIAGEFQGVTGNATLTVTAPERALNGISIEPENASIEVGNTQAYTATAFYSNNDIEPLAADEVSWSSSDPDVAQFNGTDGIVTGNSAAPDSITITAAFQGIEATASLTVTEPERTLNGIRIEPENASIVAGGTQAYTATASYSNGDTEPLDAEQVTWSSSDPDIAQFNGSDGVVTGNRAEPDPITITAAYQGFEATASLTVNEPTLTGITIAPRESTIEVGENEQYRVTGDFSDGTSSAIPASSVSWTSASPNVADLVNDEGLVLSTSTGTATITATYEDEFSSDAELTVIEAVPDEPDLVITGIEAGNPETNQDGGVDLPLRVVVQNRGGAEAAVFKIAVDYTRQNPTNTFVTAFTVAGQRSAFYPFTDAPLAAGDSVVFAGNVIFSSNARELTVSVNANADSCSGEEFTEPFCRVDESDEDNNRSSAVTVTLP